MANRIALYDRETLNRHLLAVQVEIPQAWFSPRYNIGALSAVWTLTLDTVTPRLAPAQWGLIPPWAKPGQFRRPLTHARAETVWEKASFKSLIRRYRGVMLCDGFYLFSGRANNARVMYADTGKISLGLGIIWQYNVDGNIEVSLLNTEDSALATQLGTRVPIVIQHYSLEDWLHSDDSTRINQLLSDDVPDIEVVNVSNDVRDPLKEGADCIQEIKGD